MNINFGENIRKLRIERGMTQEKLADFLGVSFQAVSKWERGDTVPDIFMLPTIASFFNVTTDYLLSFDQIEQEKEIEGYISLYYQLWQNNDHEAVLKKMKEAVRRFPAEYRLLVRYLNAVIWCGNASNEKALLAKSEAVAVYERIQTNCTDDRIRIWAKKLMCKFYKKLSEIEGSGITKEDAVKILDEMPLMQNSRDYLACSLYSSEKKDVVCKEAISELLYLMNNVVMENWANSNAHSLQERIEALETIIQINKTLYKKGDYGKNFINMTYAVAHLGCLYYRSGERNKSAEMISRSLGLAEEFDTVQGELTHTSQLLNELTIEKNMIPMAHAGALTERIRRYVFQDKKIPTSILSD